MKRINKLHLLTAVIAIASAFAFRTKPAIMTVYAFQSQDASYVYVSESLAGEMEGVHFMCYVTNGMRCKVSSNVAPDGLMRIAREHVTYLDQNKQFEDLYTPQDGDTD